MPAQSRLTVVLTPEQRATLESLSARRFGRRTSATFLYALELADTILSHPSTIRAETPRQALSAFIVAHGGHAAAIEEDARE
jgi:hypothetical protein